MQSPPRKPYRKQCCQRCIFPHANPDVRTGRGGRRGLGCISDQGVHVDVSASGAAGRDAGEVYLEGRTPHLFAALLRDGLRQLAEIQQYGAALCDDRVRVCDFSEVDRDTRQVAAARR